MGRSLRLSCYLTRIVRRVEGLPLSGVTCLGAVAGEIGARRLDIGHNEKVQRFDTQMYRGRRSRRGQLNGARSVAPDEVGVEPPAELAVEAPGAIDVGNGQDGDLELHVDR